MSGNLSTKEPPDRAWWVDVQSGERVLIQYHAHRNMYEEIDSGLRWTAEEFIFMFELCDDQDWL